MLKPFQSFRRNRALALRAVGKAEPEKLPLLRARPGASLCAIWCVLTGVRYHLLGTWLPNISSSNRLNCRNEPCRSGWSMS